MIHIAWPWLLLVLPLPWLFRWLLPPLAAEGEAILRVPGASRWRLPIASRTVAATAPAKWQKALALLSWLLLVLAACQPQWWGEALPVAASGRDLMLAIDLSGSMETRDFLLEGKTVDRLTAIKQVAGAFIARRQGDRLGLILFGSNAYLQAPFTFDRKTVQSMLDESIIGLPGKETAIGDAITLAVKKCSEPPAEPGTAAHNSALPAKRRVLLLLTDGANNAGQVTPGKAAQLAAEAGLVIYTIGIGADEMVVRTLFGSRTINPSADLDEQALAEIAAQTGGRYFRARDSEALQQIHQLLDQWEPVVAETEQFRPVITLYYWPLALAIILAGILCWWEVSERKWP
ncbi:MAG: VWA domain-containing protein [Magnetococcales bacterium]|nr:VWA domain-containing protein [Magnetococcales bacterium]